ncbi:MAG: NUDIX hydrolase [archaeon]|nr:NUDIX hydrolase [archaeon]
MQNIQKANLNIRKGFHKVTVTEKRRTTYCVVLDKKRFLMVYNTKRNGWEMPGGKIEKNETVEEAARRECLEESGYDVDVIATRDVGYCNVCACKLKYKVSNGEMQSELFDKLPSNLSFGPDEYKNVISWARSIL